MSIFSFRSVFPKRQGLYLKSCFGPEFNNCESNEFRADFFALGKKDFQSLTALIQRCSAVHNFSSNVQR